MRMSLKLLKYLGLTIGIIVLFLLIYLSMVLILPQISTKAEELDNNNIDIYLVSNGVHTDIVVPVRNEVIDWSKSIKYENTRANDTTLKWLSVGWGDKGFYLETPTWADLKFSTAFKAVFALSSSAIHATYRKNIRLGANCRAIKLNTNQYLRLVQYIKAGFSYDVHGDVQHIQTDAVYGNNDAFYEGVGSYSLFHTCNTWTNNGLKACGQKACLWTPLDKSILNLYK